MRISVETLLKLANDQVSQRAKKDRDVTAVYLYGSLLGDEPLIAGTGDIDLVFLHSQSISERREIVRITEDIHLDITHVGRDMYRQPRELRLNPWLGPVIYGCKILYDPQHVMDFVQASVRGQFHRADNVSLRARKQLEHARQIWFDLPGETITPDPAQFQTYLRAVDHAANAVAALSGTPLAERRYLQQFAERANHAGQPALVGSLLELIGGPQVTASLLTDLVSAWQQTYRSLQNPPDRISLDRYTYYLRAFEFYLAGDQPFQAVLWPLLRSWTAAAAIPESGHSAWASALEQLGLSGENFAASVQRLDAFIDKIDELLETWAKAAGV